MTVNSRPVTNKATRSVSPYNVRKQGLRQLEIHVQMLFIISGNLYYRKLKAKINIVSISLYS